MKKQIVRMMLMLALTTIALSVSAAAQGFEQHNVRLDFDFKVGAKQLPAGEYSIRVYESDHSGRTLVVRNKQTNEQAFMNVIPVVRASDSSLTFSKYGDQHFLSQVGLGDYAYQAVKTGQERKLARQYTAQVINASQLVSQAR